MALAVPAQAAFPAKPARSPSTPTATATTRSTRFTVRRAAKTVNVRVTLSGRGRGIVARNKRMRANASVTERKRRGHAATRSSRAITIKARSR